MKRRKLFCEISPITYGISILKCQLVRRMQDLFSPQYLQSKKAIPHCRFVFTSTIP